MKCTHTKIIHDKNKSQTFHLAIYHTSYNVIANHIKYVIQSIRFFVFDIYDNCMRLIKRICHGHPNAKPKNKTTYFFFCLFRYTFFIDLHIAFYSRMWYQDRLGSGDRQLGIHRRQKRQERDESHDRRQLRHAQGTC